MKILPLTLCILLSTGLMACNRALPAAVTVQPTSISLFQSEVVQASEGMLFPSESDVPFSWFEAHLHTLPDAATFAAAIGKHGEPSTQLDFNAFFDRYTQIQPWMDESQQHFAMGMQHLRETFKQNSKKLAVYRVGDIEVHIYIVAIIQGRVVGLQTISIET